MNDHFIICGTGWAGKQIASILVRKNSRAVIGFVEDEPKSSFVLVDNNNGGVSLPILGNSKDLLQIARHHNAKAVVVAKRHSQRDSLLDQLVGCYGEDILVYEMSDLYEKHTKKIPVEHVKHEGVIPSLTKPKHDLYLIFHDVMNYLLSLFGFLFVFVPLFSWIALAIKWDSRGPIFYTQHRVGLNGKVFQLIKFRTMIHNAENGKPQWAKQADKRVTRVGKLLRRFRLDELPQFINVLKGDMALIGPRPERPEFVKELGNEIPFYHYRHLVRPGISGWAQINYRYGNSVNDALEKLQYDLYWIKHRSFWLDLKIILKSVRVMMTGFGAI